MEIHVTRQLALGELRQHALTVLLGHPLFTEAEQLRATQFAHECADIVRLTRWATSVRAEIARREVEAARQRRQHALGATLHHLCTPPLRGHYPRPRPTWVVGALLPDFADRRAGTFERLTAAHFQPAAARTLADLLSCQSR